MDDDFKTRFEGLQRQAELELARAKLSDAEDEPDSKVTVVIHQPAQTPQTEPQTVDIEGPAGIHAHGRNWIVLAALVLIVFIELAARYPWH